MASASVAALANLDDLSQDPAFIDQLTAAVTVRNSKSAKNATTYKMNENELNNFAVAQQEDEEETVLARATRKASKELAGLIDNHEDYIGKITILQQKYSDLFHEMRRLEREHIKSKKRIEFLQKEKEIAKMETKKAVTMREKLESLCRELQKENKRIEEEGETKFRLEKAKREELVEQCENKIKDFNSKVEEHNRELKADFESRICDIKAELAAHKEEKLKEVIYEDDVLKDKLKTFFEQYDLRDTQFQSVLRMKDLEVQVYMARYDRQKKIADSHAVATKLLVDQASTFQETEMELRSQLNVYVEKFRQVEETLNNSNDLFLTFRNEMEQMTKKTKKLEKENKLLTKKSEIMNKNVLEMADERAVQLKEAETMKKRMIKLENLCRALQAERIALENKITELEGELHESYDDDDDVEYDDEEYDEKDEDIVYDGYDAASEDHDVESEGISGSNQGNEVSQHSQAYGPSAVESASSGKQGWLNGIVEGGEHQMHIDSVTYREQVRKAG
ncbi:myosin-like coiled-coil protein-domain-containing protein [Lipomyces arxii]|uniref:myosin-like coiled-coil protein-domain-containing protein n=1 Tax=Lipomyces arxii TaxID=56418 RepID=UPI0034CFBD0F